GFHVGASVEIPINEMISFETGLLLNTKGYNIRRQDETLKIKGRFNLLYIDIPITGKASFDVGKSRYFVSVGPYIGIGLIGNSRIEFSFEDETEIMEEEFEWGYDKESDDLKRFDYGLLIGAGMEFNSFIVAI